MEVSGSLILSATNRTCGKRWPRVACLGVASSSVWPRGQYLEHAPPCATGCVVLLDSFESEGHPQLQETIATSTRCTGDLRSRHFDVAATIEVFREFTFLLRESPSGLSHPARARVGVGRVGLPAFAQQSAAVR